MFIKLKQLELLKLMKLIKIKFLEVMILSEQKSYTFAYSNLLENFDNEI